MSRFARPLSRVEIDGIGAHAARRNTDDGVTGVLLTMGSVFFQIIEGNDTAVDDLYARVLADDRHTDVVCLLTERDVDDRLFPDWSMNVYDLDVVGGGEVVEPLKLVLDRLGEAQRIVDRYTQPAVSRIMSEGRNPLDEPLRQVERLVLFSDMVGFSAISDRLQIEDVSELVTLYLETCSTGIVAGGGEVTKFLGDGVMAYFEADAADDAIHSCVAIGEEFRRIRDRSPTDSALRVLHSGFGLAVGTVLEGSMGSSVKMDYTIIGEPVNTAAKLEALTRELGSPILMTEAVARRLRGEWELTLHGEFDVGRGDPSCVYGVGAERIDLRAEVRRRLDEMTPRPD